MVVMPALNMPTHPLHHMNSGATPAEIMKYVRQNMVFKENDYTPEKIKSRSMGGCSTFKAPNEWKSVLARRSEQRKCGFFSRQDESYRECGRVDLDTKNLVLSSLKKVGNASRDEENKEKWKKLSMFIHAEEHKKNFHELLVNRTERQHTKKRLAQMIRAYEISHTNDIDNGMAVIRKKLLEAERRIISVKGGQSLRAYVREEEEKKRRKEEEEVSSGNTLDMVIIDPLQEVNTGTESETDIELQTDSQISKCRPIRQFIDTLDSLIHILTPLQNIRQRDLKSRHPLSKETLKMLRKPIRAGEPSNAGGNNTRISFSREQDRGKSSDNNPPPSRKKNMHSRYNNYRQRTSIVPGPELPTDTWEHFLTLGNSDKTENSNRGESEQSSRHGSRQSMLSQIVKNLPIAKRMVLINPYNGKTDRHDSMTPWQRASAEQKDSEETRNTVTSQTAQKHDVILDQLKEGFYVVKRTYAEELESDLRSRTDGYKMQLETLELNHLRETDMRRMRRKNTDWRRQVLLSTARPAAWFQELNDKLDELDLSDDYEALTKLQELSKFMDLKSSCGSVKAKLCLLFFSYPLHELCTITMLKAFLFATTKVLEIPRDAFAEWMNIRKLGELLTLLI